MMEKKTFKVPNIGCAGCVAAVENELGMVEGMNAVNADLATKMVTVEYEAPATWSGIVQVLSAIDYAPEGETA